jgi:hypothetical protein
MLRCVHLIVDPDFAANIGMPIEDAVDEWYRIIEFGLLPRPESASMGRRGAIPAPVKRQDDEWTTGPS